MRQPQVFGVAPTPEPQAKPAGQVPQFSVPPQPSAIEPQCAPAAAQVVGTQVGMHWFAEHAEPAPQ